MRSGKFQVRYEVLHYTLQVKGLKDDIDERKRCAEALSDAGMIKVFNSNACGDDERRCGLCLGVDIVSLLTVDSKF